MKSISLTLLASAAIAAGCGRGESPPPPSSDIVAQYRDTVLRMSDIVRQIPPALSSADSAAMAAEIADRWIDGFLIEDLAASQIDDIDRIDRLASDYRRSLIAESYRRKMRSKGVEPVDMDRVRKYYRSHMADMRLERPVVKGLFIKVPANSGHLEEIRGWMRNAGTGTYDALENAGRRDAVVFRFFDDRWVDFDAVAGEIPYRFADADAFLNENADFETEHNGMVYILHISDFRSSGDLMPEQYAAPIIEDMLKAGDLAAYEAGLIKALRKTAIEKNILKEGSYTR